jgi:hypothetical protein
MMLDDPRVNFAISTRGRTAAGKFGLTSAPTRLTPGASSRSSPSRFGSIRFVDVVTPWRCRQGD